MKQLFYLAVLFLVMTNCRRGLVPVSSGASGEAKDLLNYLHSLEGEYILSGQHNYGHELTRSTDSIVAMTGKYPAIWGCDFIPNDFNNPIDRSETINEVIRQHEQGAIITLMYHQGRPYADSLGHFRDDITEADWQALLTPGTPIYNTWLADMDNVAEHLKILRDRNIPVLWRPYHEMNGAWFWWGQRRGPEGYTKLWKMLYNRFTEYHRLNNLIWVWNANAPRDWKDDEALAYDWYYPGDEYVDILAADVYKADYKQSHHDQLIELGSGKPIALGEIGKVPDPAILTQQPKWTWFMIWARFPWTHNTKEELKALYSDPKVLTLDELEH